MIATDGIQTIANAEPRVEDDEFQCDDCKKILDVEDSIRRGKDELICPACSERGCPHCGETDPEVFFDTPGDELAWCYRCGKHSPSQLAQGPRRGAQDNGQQWNDDRCACGGKICDSPAGDKCWDCFNHDPSE